ncbi:peptide deformylase [Terriglobus saanensis]|uniref:Peptide deformylase n=1 Tax=Terriglobus saanensis (strain ATCC BAA-1853 / DSM 23119 / SP1PR4) TaxID=401053 RepID=E8UXC5_TERSS|nr:peptide deformylase [Terriglobus saanensis]ADV84149.1 peptide deformylase [Terriglobus saanensis SP1PR4]
MLLNICTAGDPVLRKQARALSQEEILSPAIQELVKNMRETMWRAPGVGLAAPQIGESLQLAVLEGRPQFHKKMNEAEVKEWQSTPYDYLAIFNPKIELLPAHVSAYEGCLSIPGFMASVPRSQSVRVTCLNEKAEPQVIEAEGWFARILQHEIDHLNGVLYIDRMESGTFTTIEHYKQYVAPPVTPS